MIFVFKTSVKTKIEANILGQQIDKILPYAKWNFDLKDCDRILRIECQENIVMAIKALLNFHNYSCEELE